MDGQANARSGNGNSTERSDDICKKRPRNRNRGTDDQRHKLLVGMRHIMVHSKLERQTKTSEGYQKKSNGCVRNNNYHGYCYGRLR